MLNNCEPAVVLEFYCLFTEHLGVLAYYIQQFFNIFHNRVEFLHDFGWSSEFRKGFEPSPPHPRYTTGVKTFTQFYVVSILKCVELHTDFSHKTSLCA